jgi:hypothetical protein
MVAYPLGEFEETPRHRLRRLDFLLEELEDLNLRDMSNLPVRVGSALQRFGVEDPYRRSIPELIDRVFDLQEPVLAMLRPGPIQRRF